MGRAGIVCALAGGAVLFIFNLIAGSHARAADGGNATQNVKLLLDWRPEPEFGGFYAGNLAGGSFGSHHLNVNIAIAGEGAPTWQLLASGRADFATTAADQVIIARSQKADVVAIFAVYQTFPQGVMVHASRHFKSLADVFQTPGTLAAEDDPWLHFCENKFAPVKATITSYAGGFAPFLARGDYSQQCFVTSEPILAKRQGGDPQTFLVADSGYNPYTTVVITRGQTVREHLELVKAMTEACRDGWRAYLDDPSAANAAMGKLNKEMDAQTFADAAAAQKPLIDTAAGVGSMTLQRWQELERQLVELKLLKASDAPGAEGCFLK